MYNRKYIYECVSFVRTEIHIVRWFDKCHCINNVFDFATTQSDTHKVLIQIIQCTVSKKKKIVVLIKYNIVSIKIV